MNFLSHFYFDRHTIDTLQVVGIVLPDLVKNAKKDWNIHPEKNEHKFSADSGLSQILKGWNRHLEVDKYFHSSEFFKEHTSEIRTAVAPFLENSPARAFFVAHIALELMLDSLLLTESVLNTENFYRHLSTCDREVLHRFLQLNNIEQPQIFFSFFDEFIEAEYLNTYREADKIVYAINQICRRIWLDPFSETQKLQLTAVLIDYQLNLRNEFMHIFDQIDESLNKNAFMQ